MLSYSEVGVCPRVRLVFLFRLSLPTPKPSPARALASIALLSTLQQDIHVLPRPCTPILSSSYTMQTNSSDLLWCATDLLVYIVMFLRLQEKEKCIAKKLVPATDGKHEVAGKYKSNDVLRWGLTRTSFTFCFACLQQFLYFPGAGVV